MTARSVVSVWMAVGLTAGMATADVFNMGGTRNQDGSWSGLASLETVPVGNPGNAGDSRYGGYGSVGYTYNIGRYEVTAGQYTEFLNAVARTDTYGLYNPFMDNDAHPFLRGCNIKRSGTPGNYTYSVAPEWANRPVNYVSWGDAARFANWLHNGQPTGAQDLSTTEDGAYYLNGATSNEALLAVTRKPGWKWAIPSEDEWYKAAYHKNDGATGNYWDYPTRSNSMPGRDLNDASGNNANYYGNPVPIQSPYYTTLVGEFQNSASPYGTFDQGGNLWEWNEQAVHYGDHGSYRGVRGGSFNDDVTDLAAWVRFNHCPTTESDDLGFRVAQIPEPATLALLAFGLLAAGRRGCPPRRAG